MLSYVPSPPGFLRGLRELCDKHGLLLIADEVQSGFGAIAIAVMMMTR